MSLQIQAVYLVELDQNAVVAVTDDKLSLGWLSLCLALHLHQHHRQCGLLEPYRLILQIQLVLLNELLPVVKFQGKKYDIAVFKMSCTSYSQDIMAIHP